MGSIHRSGFMNNKKTGSILLLLQFFLLCCDSSGQQSKSSAMKISKQKTQEIAAFAEGCFWCSEHIFEDLVGVDSVVSGYAGGHVENPTYEEVCRETTGHAETVLIYYNSQLISYSDLLDVFFQSHDPTTLNKQGPDVGSSYRSAIFYVSSKQRREAGDAIARWKAAFKNPIVTQLDTLRAFYRAEEFHQNYVKANPYDAYIRNVSVPRFNTFKEKCKLQFKPINK